MKPFTAFLLLLVGILTALLVLCSAANCQVLCIEPPLQATPDELLRVQVESMFMQKGYQVGCENYDLAVSFYYLGGVGHAAVTDFYTEFATAPGVVIGSLTTSQRQVYSSQWTMTIRPRGKVIPLYRTHTTSLSTATNKVSKYLKHSRIYKLE